ncbi:MAG: hypothetical protein COA97_12415 [Flavobacteriales bacterium]|nr:MAG: hypothetical protein COA97_12415 [Flavobacteriales bacterium]
MKKFILASVILLFTLTSFSQTIPKIEFGALNENSRLYSYNIKAIGSDETAIYSKKKGIYFPDGTIVKHDKSMKFIKKNKIELKKGRSLEFICYFNDKIYVFSLELNKKKKKNTLYAQTVNKETLELNDDEKIIIDVKYTSNNKFFGVRLQEYSFGSISSDGTKLIISHLAYGSAIKYRKNPDKINSGIYVFDGNLNLLWNQSKLLANEASLLDNDGNFYSIINQTLISVTNNGETKKEYILDSDKERFFFDYRTKTNSEGEIIFAGLYKNGSAAINKSDFNSQGNYKHFTDGTFLVKFNPTNKSISDVVFDDYNSPLYDCHMKDLILTEDGSITLMEKFYTEEKIKEKITTTTNQYGNTTGIDRDRTSTTLFIHEDIIVLKRNHEGVELWTKDIQKKQRSSNRNAISFNFIYLENSLFLLYYEIVDKKLVYYMVEVTMFTEEKKSILFSEPKVELRIIPNFTLYNKDKNELILYGVHKNYHGLLSITF